jgi:NAD(P) transhydrogenase subunit alpha
MDALSSMANIAGYKAVLLAAAELPRMFPMMMTAAGTISPARVFVIGAGVAGLQAIATAKRLGAIVSGYDVRPAVKEQVESLGAKFVEMGLDTSAAEDKGGYAKEQSDEFLRKQREMMAKVVAEHDVVITTAAIPGKKSPVLVTADMVRGMKAGSVIIDLAAERGGNCESTKCDERVEDHGVLILGPSNLPSSVPVHASQMYSRNIQTLLNHFVKDGTWKTDMDDEITAGSVVTLNGEIVHPRIRSLMDLPSLDPPKKEEPDSTEAAATTGAAEGGQG